MFRKSSPLVIAGLTLGLSQNVFALGLGEIKLHSNLNQPLNAEIRLLSADSLSKEQIIANLANVEEFNRAGVEHSFFLHQLRFKPIFKNDGSVIIKVTTKQPVKEPFLDFLVEVNWPNGRVMREYTLLLDPPVFSKVEMSSAPATPTTATTESQNTSFDEQRVETQTVQNDDWDVSTNGSYQVKGADTLWSIARKNRPQSVSIQRMMVAVFESNPDAFINNNMNEMKTGAVLQMPDENGVTGISQQQALLEIARQNQLWGGHGNAGTRPDGMVDTASYSATLDQSGNTKDRLKLSVPSNDAATNKEIMQSEAVATLSDENATLKSKVDQQAEQIEELKRKLAIQNNSLATLQNSDAQQETPQETTDTGTSVDENIATTEPETDVVPKDETTTETETGIDSADNTQPETGTQDIASTDQNIPAQVEQKTEQLPSDVMKQKTSDAVNQSPIPVTPRETSFMDSVLSLGLSVWMAIGSGILVLFFSILWYRRKNMEEEAFQESLVVPIEGDIDEDELPEVGDDILAADMDDDFIPESEAMSDEQTPVDVETNADPLGEADVYLAYGKYQQAEKILKDAIEEDPERTDLRLKLMECFAESKALSEFNEQKREIMDILATDAAVAEKVSHMERDAWPEESEQDELPSTEDIFGDLSFSSDDEEESNEDELVFPEEEAEQELANEVEADDDSIEYTPTSEAESINEESAALDDELESLSDDATDELSDELENTELDFDDSDLEFTSRNEDIDENEKDEDGADLDMEDSEFIDELDAEIDEADEEIDESILELGDVDEASTKLDLARAYIDMEDYDGAHEILKEVISEGNETQKKEAEELLDQMN